jgi:septum formation protein
MIFLDVLKDYEIILASQSPRRQALLKEAGIDYKLAPKIDVDESFNKKLKKEKIPLFLSILKAGAYLDNLTEKNQILITADTIVWQNNSMLGKPTSEKDAYNIVKQLSDSKHYVYTGVTLTSLKKQVSFYAKTSVY